RISQRGLLSLSYSINGGAYQQVIKSQDITAANGPLPAGFLFGFAGSTGGSTNIHEILCFKAAPATTAARSAGASEKQSAKLDAGDTSGSPSLSSLSCPTSPSPTPYAANDRLAFLRGDRSCEVSTAGVGLFRRRSDVLGDIVDSSPAWVGPPIAPYTAVWSDRLYPSATNPETASGSQTYTQFVTAAQTRTNVVYVGSNDGLLHGFRSGS